MATTVEAMIEHVVDQDDGPSYRVRFSGWVTFRPDYHDGAPDAYRVEDLRVEVESSEDGWVAEPCARSWCDDHFQDVEGVEFRLHEAAVEIAWAEHAWCAACEVETRDCECGLPCPSCRQVQPWQRAVPAWDRDERDVRVRCAGCSVEYPRRDVIAAAEACPVCREPRDDLGAATCDGCAAYVTAEERAVILAERPGAPEPADRLLAFLLDADPVTLRQARRAWPTAVEAIEDVRSGDAMRRALTDRRADEAIAEATGVAS